MRQENGKKKKKRKQVIEIALAKNRKGLTRTRADHKRGRDMPYGNTEPRKKKAKKRRTMEEKEQREKKKSLERKTIG